MTIHYVAVYSAGKLLVGYPNAEHPRHTNNVDAIVASVVPKEYQKRTIVKGSMNYHYMSTDKGMIIVCAATEDTKARVAFPFIDSIKWIVDEHLSDDNLSHINLSNEFPDEFFAKDARRHQEMAIAMIKREITYFNNPANNRDRKIDCAQNTTTILVPLPAPINIKQPIPVQQTMWEHIKTILLIIWAICTIVLIVLLIRKSIISTC